MVRIRWIDFASVVNCDCMSLSFFLSDQFVTANMHSKKIILHSIERSTIERSNSIVTSHHKKCHGFSFTQLTQLAKLISLSLFILRWKRCCRLIIFNVINDRDVRIATETGVNWCGTCVFVYARMHTAQKYLGQMLQRWHFRWHICTEPTAWKRQGINLNGSANEISIHWRL